MTTPVTRLVVRSDPAEVPGLQSQLLTLCGEAGLDDLGAFQLTCAIVEAVNNCIEHAYSGETGHLISLRWLRGPESIAVEIRDSGQTLPLGTQQTRAPADVYAESGRGWQIIRQWTDSAIYERENDDNVLTLTRRL